MIKVPEGYKVVTLPNGDVNIVKDEQPSAIQQRFAENSTAAGAAGLAGSALAVFTGVTAGLAGDIPTAISVGLPGLIGVVAAFKAIITPDHGVTDEDITNAVSRMSRDQLLGLLNSPAVQPTAATVQQSATTSNV
jgi:hypothetical protein